MSKVLSPKLLAITGGSGSGKSWLAERLAKFFGPEARRISQDSFYRDRSHLSEKRREQVNYDHPRAIDWGDLEKCLRQFRAGQCVTVPAYDFKTHCRVSAAGTEQLNAQLLVVEGLWLLRRPAVRRCFDVSIFIDCPERLRLSRRMDRDVTERGRTPESVRRQFREAVAPMHKRYIASQIRYADLVLKQPLTESAVGELGAKLRRILEMETQSSPGNTKQSGLPGIPQVPDKIRYECYD